MLLNLQNNIVVQSVKTLEEEKNTQNKKNLKQKKYKKVE